MSLHELLAALEATSVGTAIRESTWLFPTIETVHVFAITLVLGSIAIVDLRLLNLASRNRSITELTREVLPWTWVAFVLAAISGSLLFSSSAIKYSQNAPFKAKLLLMVAAGINMLFFQFGTYRSVSAWDRGATPAGARLAGVLSLSLWFAVMSLGRWIGFTA